MGLPGINIDQQLSKIGLRTGHARLNINAPKGQLTIKNTRSRLNVDTQMPTFRVNKAQLRSELNLAAPLDFSKSYRDKGKQTALQAAGQYKADGNYLGDLRNPGDKVPALSKNKAMARLQPKQTNIGLMPRSTPDLIWEKGQININWSKHDLVIDYNGRNTAEVSAETNYPVEVFLTQRPYFRVSVVELLGNSGRHINSAV